VAGGTDIDVSFEATVTGEMVVWAMGIVLDAWGCCGFGGSEDDNEGEFAVGTVLLIGW